MLAPAVSAISTVVVYAVSFPLLVLCAALFGASFPLLGHVSGALALEAKSNTNDGKRTAMVR